MKKIIMFFILSAISMVQYGQIIADHRIVADFDKIPQSYIDLVRQMWMVYAGESHSLGIRTGLTLLESSYPSYAVNVVESGTPQPYTASYLRASRATWGDLNNLSGWVYSYGEEDWFTSATAISRTKAGITYSNTHSFAIAAIGFGWCWDPAITDMANYINATQSYIDYCTTNGYSTKVFYTTGTVDSYTGETGYLKHLGYESIRNYVSANSSEVLFDYADILCYNDDGSTNTTTWNEHTYPIITGTNLGDGSVGHIGTVGATRLAKAMWWMLARIAGWDGVSITIWNGTASNIWNNPANWTGGIPTNTSNVVIPRGLANYPVGSESQDFTVGEGRSMIVEPAAQVTLNKLTNNGTLWLKSDESGIASLKIGSYIDNGSEKIELYLTGGTHINSEDFKWHYISSPVKYLSTNIFTSGEYPTQDLSAFYENLTTDIQNLAWFAFDGWDYQNEVDTDNGFDSLKVGQGYNYYYGSPVTRTIEGTLKTASVTRELSYSGTSDYDVTKGWNLLGNPFTATLNWDKITKPGGVDNAVYFTLNNTFASYVAGIGIPEGTTAKIPPMQGFFVKANTKNPIQSIVLPVLALEHSLQARYKGEDELIPHIRLKLESQKTFDETVIRFDEKAYNAFDSEFDAYKFSKTGTCVSLWTMIGPVSYSINGLPFPEDEVDVPVGLNIEESGTFKLSATSLEGLVNYQVFLMDKATGMTANLRTTPTFNFEASKGMISDRFVIKVLNISTGVENPVMAESKFNIFSSNDQINIQPLSEEWDGRTGSIKVLDITGQTVSYFSSVEFWEKSTVSVSAPTGTGIYFVEIISKTNRFVEKIVVK